VEILKKHSGIAIVDSVVEGSNSGVNDDKEQGLKLDDTVSGTQSNVVNDLLNELEVLTL